MDAIIMSLSMSFVNIVIYIVVALVSIKIIKYAITELLSNAVEVFILAKSKAHAQLGQDINKSINVNVKLTDEEKR